MLERLKRKPAEHSAVGIDLQNDGIVIAVARNGASPRRLSCEYVPWEQAADFPAVIEKLVDKRDLKGQPAVLVLPPEEYSLLQTSTPAMNHEEMRAAAGWKIGELINYPVEQAVVDIFEYPESGQRGSDRKLYVVAARASDIEEHVGRMRKTAMELKAIDIGELALRNVVAQLPENEQGVVVLTLSEHSGQLVVIIHSEIYLARRFELGYDDLMLGDERLFDDLVLQLQRSLDFFESHFTQALPAKLLIFPPDKVSGELILHINSHLKLDAEPLILEQLTDYNLELDEMSQSRCIQAIGAALRDKEALQ